MGAWGYKVEDSDTVLDVEHIYDRNLSLTKSHEKAAEATYLAFKESLVSLSDEAEFWLGILHSQHKYGEVSDSVLARARQIHDEDAAFELWIQEGEEALSNRKSVVQQFFSKMSSPPIELLSIPNPEEFYVAEPGFSIGDCISVRRSEGEVYGSAMVLNKDSRDPFYICYLIGVTDYQGIEEPTIDSFEEPVWRTLAINGNPNADGIPNVCWYAPDEWEDASPRVRVVGNIQCPSGFENADLWDYPRTSFNAL